MLLLPYLAFSPEQSLFLLQPFPKLLTGSPNPRNKSSLTFPYQDSPVSSMVCILVHIISNKSSCSNYRCLPGGLWLRLEGTDIQVDTTMGSGILLGLTNGRNQQKPWGKRRMRSGHLFPVLLCITRVLSPHMAVTCVVSPETLHQVWLVSLSCDCTFEYTHSI